MDPLFTCVVRRSLRRYYLLLFRGHFFFPFFAFGGL
jgi:hypothetical protein